MKIICIGDSFTFGLGVNRRKDSWFALLASRLEESNIEMINKGINGDTTSGMLARFGRDILDEKPDYVLITGGVNDIVAAGCSNMPKNNYMAMVHQAYHGGIKPIIGIAPDIDPKCIRDAWVGFADYDKVLIKQRKLREHLIKMNECFNVPFIDFQDYEPWLQALSTGEELMIDGMHLTKAGHQYMAESAFEKMIKIIK